MTDHRTPFDPDEAPHEVLVDTGPFPEFPPTVLEETHEFVVHVDSWGIVRRDLKGRESMSEFLSFPVTDRRSWEQYRDERLNPDDPARLDGNWRAEAAVWAARGWPIYLGNFPDGGIFGPLRWLLGDEEELVAFYTAPDLVHEIMDHMTSLYLTVWEKVVHEVRVDEIQLWEDMCYRGGPLISPKHWEQFMGPCYRRIRRFADEHAILVLSVDSDGDPDLITPPMLRAGVNLLLPIEVAAGCDVNTWRARYPTLGMMGGIDKRALAQGPAAIDRELARIAPAVAAGRYIPDLDHLIPDDVSWDNYCYYAEALKRLVGKE